MGRSPSRAYLGTHQGDVITAPISTIASPPDESSDELDELDDPDDLGGPDELDELDELDEPELRASWLTRSSSPASAGAGRPTIPSATKTIRRHRRFKQAGIWMRASQRACRDREHAAGGEYPWFLW